MKWWTDEEITKYSKDNLLRNDNEVYGKRFPGLTFCPGLSDNGCFTVPLDNMCIVGSGAERSHFVETLVQQFNMRYGPWQMRIHIWDGCGDLVHAHKHYEYCELHGVCCDFTETDLRSFLEERSFNSNVDCGSNIACEVIILHSIATTLSKSTDCARNNILYFIRKLMNENNIYVIITHGKELCLDNYIISCSYHKVHFGFNGNSILVDTQSRIVDFKPLYYTAKTLRCICDRQTLPRGVRFSDYKLERLRELLPSHKGSVSIISSDADSAAMPSNFLIDLLDHLVGVRELEA